MIELLHANQELKQKEFAVSLELLFRFVAYQQPLSNFFIMCESAPYIFAEKELSDNNEAENTSIVNPAVQLVNNGTRRTNLIKSAQIYLSKLSENLLKFIRLYRKQIQTDDSVDILAQLYTTVPPQVLQKYGELLNLAEVRKMICSVTREDEMFYQLSKFKKFKQCRHFLMNHLIDKFCSRDVTSLTTGDARENILIIMHNLEIYKPGADKQMNKRIDQVVNILHQYVTEDNPFQFRDNLPAVVLRPRSSLSRDYSNSDGNGKSKSSKSTKKPKAAKSSTSTKSTAQNTSSLQGSSSTRPMVAVSSSASPMATVAVEVVPIAVAHLVPERVSAPSTISHSCYSSSLTTTRRNRSSDEESTVAHTSQKPYPTVAESSFTSQTPNRQKSLLTPISELHSQVPSVTLPEKSKQKEFTYDDLDAIAEDFSHVDLTDYSKRRRFLKFSQMSFHVLAELCYDWEFSVEDLSLPKSYHIENFEENRSIQSKYACQLWHMLRSKVNARRASSSNQSSSSCVKNDMEEIEVTGRQIDVDQAGSAAAAAVGDERPPYDKNGMMDVIDHSNSGNDTSGDERPHDNNEEMMDVVDATTRSDDGCVGKIDVDQTGSAAASASISVVVADASANNDEVVFEQSLMNSAQLLSTRMVTTHDKQLIFPACAMTLYLHGIRAHFLTRPFFRRRKSYAKLNSAEYEQKRNLLLMFQSGTLTMHKIIETYGCKDFYGERSITTVIKAMFFKDRGDSPLLIKRLVLPRLPRTEEKSSALSVEADLLGELNEAISKAISCPPLSSSSSSSSSSSTTSFNNADMSLVFIDIASFDLSPKGASTVMDFPNRMIISRPEPGSQALVKYVYQTVGAIYKYVREGEDQYIIRVFARGRFAGSFFLREFIISNNSMKEVGKPLNSLLYIDDFDYIEGNIPTLTLSNSKAKIAPSMFPSIIKEYGFDKGPTYCLDGLVLCLNDGQREGLIVGHNDKLLREEQDNPSYWLKIQNSMSRLDPIFECFGQTLYSREMDILEGNEKWLSDEIINAAMCKFSQVGSDLRVFSADRLVTFFPLIAFQSIIEFFKTYADSLAAAAAAAAADSQSQSNLESQTEKTKSKSKPKIAPVLPKEVMAAQFSNAYNMSKDLWEHENIFLNPRWYFSIVNYPDHSHWMFIAIHSGEKFFYIYDPLYQKSYHDAVEILVELYIDAEATDFAASPEELNSLKFSKWEKKFSTSQKQPDKINCGVMALIGCFRATVQILNEASGNKPFRQIRAEICRQWSCNTSPKAMEKYRLFLKELLIEQTVPNDPAGFLYFSKTLQLHINNGGSSF